MKRVLINGRWPLTLPDHRADRPEWPYWEATRLAAMHHYIEPGDVVYDIGAEAGDFGALFATWGAEVVLIEPNPKAWPTIRAVWEGNDLTPAATVEAMLSDDTARFAGVVHMRTFPADAGGKMVTDHGFHHIGQHNDPTSTVDALARAIIPDVLTIDVEGGEAHVLRGAQDTLADVKPAVFVSVHPQFMADLYSESDDEIHEMMADHGYHGRFLCEDHEQHWVFTHPERRVFPGVAPPNDYYRPGKRIVL